MSMSNSVIYDNFLACDVDCVEIHFLIVFNEVSERMKHACHLKVHTDFNTAKLAL